MAEKGKLTDAIFQKECIERFRTFVKEKRMFQVMHNKGMTVWHQLDTWMEELKDEKTIPRGHNSVTLTPPTTVEELIRRLLELALFITVRKDIQLDYASFVDPKETPTGGEPSATQPAALQAGKRKRDEERNKKREERNKARRTSSNPNSPAKEATETTKKEKQEKNTSDAPLQCRICGKMHYTRANPHCRFAHNQDANKTSTAWPDSEKGKGLESLRV